MLTFGVVVEKRSLCHEEVVFGEDIFEIVELTVLLVGALIELLACIEKKNESHDVLGELWCDSTKLCRVSW